MASRTLDIYTSNIPLTQKARFWSDFVSSLKGDLVAKEKSIMFTPSLFSMYKPMDVTLYDIIYGEQDLCARDYVRDTTWYPGVHDILPQYYPDLTEDLGRTDSHMMRRAQRAWTLPPRHIVQTPERSGLSEYNPIHTDIYGHGRRRGF
ncbi:uncharacterized protein LOC111717799 isoform X1 [Eurytemora carolleeae]|uniref:uncharacterized protein LOC111717799 isoform X1 n=1 Tax=Eurytemora carolleeae TaxID=1294199 RepID=UPI000C792B93|nr:uncharacterized protein LOC111717799 isoform X1 [Eurytemora carolleeae]|eukprot:XP_023349013.1 uncharacterized protein LOC111717799 isoform X1 [Eurytemora affinis]